MFPKSRRFNEPGKKLKVSLLSAVKSSARVQHDLLYFLALQSNHELSLSLHVQARVKDHIAGSME